MVEADAADDFVRDPVPEAGLFQRSGLRVDSIGHDAVAQDEFLVPDEAVDLLDNELRLLFLGVSLGDRHRGAGVVAGEQVLRDAVLVGRDEAPRGFENGAGGAVVLREMHLLGVRVVLLEREDVADVGVAPGVDRLIGVADDGEIAVLVGELACDLVLGHVRVLELVDHDVDEPLLVLRPRLRRLAEQVDRPPQQVVEVHGAAAFERGLVLDEHAVDDLVVLAGRPCEALRPEQLRLRGADRGEDGARRVAFGVDVDLLHGLLDQADLVVGVHDDELFRDADSLAVAAQNHGAEAVEGARREVLGALAQQPREPFAHLPRRAVRERHGGDAPRAHADFLHEIGDPMGDDARLPRAGARDDQEGSLDVLDGFPLGRVEPFAEGVEGL